MDGKTLFIGLIIVGAILGIWQHSQKADEALKSYPCMSGDKYESGEGQNDPSPYIIVKNGDRYYRQYKNGERIEVKKYTTWR